MPNPDGSETPQERMTRLLAQSHGATMNAAAPIADATTDRVKAGMVAPATGGGIAGDMTRALQDQTAAARTAGTNAFTNNGVGGMGIDRRLGANEFAQDRTRGVGMVNGLMQERASAGQFQAPGVTAGQVGHAGDASYSLDDANGQQIRGQQMGYLDSLRAAANGQAPSVAEAQMHQAMSTAARNSLGIAAQARGGDAVAARRAAILGNASQGAQAAQGAAALRAQEIATARGQLGGALSDVRSTDTSAALAKAGAETANAQANLGRTSAENTTQAGLSTGASEANATNALGANAQNVGERAGLLNGALTASGQVDQATGTQAALNEEEIKRQSDYHLQQQAANKAMIGAGLGALATGGAALIKSDARAKKDIHPESPKELDAFTKSLLPVAYRYKDGGDGKDAPAGADPDAFTAALRSAVDGGAADPLRHGVMAQDLEKSKIGRSVVHTGPDGMKRVDTSALTMALAGAVAQLAKERRLGGRER